MVLMFFMFWRLTFFLCWSKSIWTCCSAILFGWLFVLCWLETEASSSNESKTLSETWTSSSVDNDAIDNLSVKYLFQLRVKTLAQTYIKLWFWKDCLQCLERNIRLCNAHLSGSIVMFWFESACSRNCSTSTEFLCGRLVAPSEQLGRVKSSVV